MLRAVGVAAAGSLAGCGGGGDAGGDGATDRTTDGAPTSGESAAGVRAETLAEGFTSPVDVAFPAGLDRWFVADQPGRVYLYDSSLRETPFLDLRDRVVDLRGYDERGLLGVATHPAFADNGRLFARYSSPPRSGTPDGYSHTFVLSEFRVDPTARRGDPESERVLLEIPEPQSNHNGGAVAFGPDGYLYAGVGDGGGTNDVGRGHVEDWYAENRGGNGQDVTENLLGSVLRIDVDDESEGRPYGIPDGNPLVGRAGRDEQYAWGFRNPWRLSFDAPESDGSGAGQSASGRSVDFYVADVGQNRYEEVSLVEAGGNYGWNVYEGTHCFSTEPPGSPPADCPTEMPDGDPLREPIIEYDHGGDQPNGVAVVGGYRYHRDDVPELSGAYVFADWQANGRVFAARPAEEGQWPVDVHDVSGLGEYVLAFGRDDAGRLYALTSDRGDVAGETGAVVRLRPEE
ncbi:PQQ-dependent sugar dehydrogenase [Salinirarus marinus]|uniref:PQQ-dependent sugar dehydrogenase n=1 Tax=Salinirarus marinus TaxID=3068310 RepID=UPI003C6BF6DF